MLALVKATGGNSPFPYLNFADRQVIIATAAAAYGTPVISDAVLIQTETPIHFRLDGEVANDTSPALYPGESMILGIVPKTKVSVIRRTGEANGRVIITPLASVNLTL